MTKPAAAAAKLPGGHCRGRFFFFSRPLRRPRPHLMRARRAAKAALPPQPQVVITPQARRGRRGADGQEQTRLVIDNDGSIVVRIGGGFGEYLVHARVITRAQLFSALHLHYRERCRVGEAVVKLGMCTEDSIEEHARPTRPPSAPAPTSSITTARSPDPRHPVAEAFPKSAWRLCLFRRYNRHSHDDRDVAAGDPPADRKRRSANQRAGFSAHRSDGKDQTVIGCVGHLNPETVDPRQFELLAGVAQVVSISSPTSCVAHLQARGHGGGRGRASAVGGREVVLWRAPAPSSAGAGGRHRAAGARRPARA